MSLWNCNYKYSTIFFKLPTCAFNCDKTNALSHYFVDKLRRDVQFRAILRMPAKFCYGLSVWHADVYEEKRECRNKFDNRRRQRTDHFDSHAVSKEPHSRCSNRRRKKQRRAREMDTDEMTRWRKRRWMTVEGVRNVDRMLYQTRRLPSLFRIRMCVRLTYSCTRTASCYSSYSPFRIPSPRTRAHAHSHRDASEGLAKNGKERRQEVECMCRRQSTVYKVDKGIITFARFKSTSVSIDLWSWDERILTYILRCRDFPPSSILAHFSRYPRISIDHETCEIQSFPFMKKAIFTFKLVCV